MDKGRKKIYYPEDMTPENIKPGQVYYVRKKDMGVVFGSGKKRKMFLVKHKGWLDERLRGA